ncbi:hypothetical protein F5B22DRAFT_582773 [Xylaria bambusicola]|uniref:uncharacterized protein n=1 Tax=Xylaria bambusicola TaxID=326684 RepID=UPI002008C480|nr:uncharacterized protein F5B22DRAFT_582773 [Xylaria bambusicola]KAI0527904.1 hypothetical protein F5B22DRAFT_582773 [Xylaria bambusicola]
MSSMLKKTGGLSFKPKAGRRPGTGASKPPTSSASTATTRVPTSEPQSQVSTPAASNPATPSVVGSIETVVDEASIPPTTTEPLPTPANTQPLSTSTPTVEVPAVDPTPAPAVSPQQQAPPTPPVTQNPTPQPNDEATHDAASTSGSGRRATDSSSNETSSENRTETRVNLPGTAKSPPLPSINAPRIRPEQPNAESEGATGPRRALPPPVSDPTSSVSRSGETAASQRTTSRKSAPRKRKSAVANGETNAEDSAPKKKRQRRKSNTSATAENDTNSEAVKPTRRRKRESTPENAEELTVDHTTMTVGELTKDLGIGKRFRHAEEIEQRAREARAKNRLRRLEREKRKLGLLGPEDEDSLSQPDTPNESGENRGAAMAQLGASMEAGAAQGVGYDVVDGQIVVHAASLVVDRHNRDMQNLEEVEENDFTNLVNSASFAKRVQAPGSWTDEETDKFYRLLRAFGTDFETISNMFPGKNRRAIKLKFNKEERLRPNRVNAAMMVRGQKKTTIDIDEYKASQRKWQAKDKILAEHAKFAEEKEAEVSRLREERRAAGLIDDDNTTTPGDNANKTNENGNGQENGEYEVIEEDADAQGQGGQGQDVDVNMDAQPEGVQT